MEETIDHYNNVLNTISIDITPLEAKLLLNAKLTIPETLDLKQRYASLHQVEKPNKRLLLEYGLIFMVGLPASGKTTFSNTILIHFDTTVIHLNQDEIGRSGCYDTLCKFAKKQDKTIILDRCNLTSAERADWISTYNSLSNRPILCVHFNTPADVCKKRLVGRKNHDMKNPYVIDDLATKLQLPQQNEGFRRVVEINEEDDLVSLYSEFGIHYTPIHDMTGLKKFVRTKHIIKLKDPKDESDREREDLIWTEKELGDFLKYDLVIEEKVDGANLGIFLDEDNNIIIQNRSHYIHPGYHKQFATIDKWKYAHEDDIRQVLGNNPWIIYGEWVVARHSIHYTRLPDKFILFDIYDRTTDKFFSRSKVEELISGTQFKQIRKIAEGKFTKAQLRKFVDPKAIESIYYDGPIEGIYVRCFNDDNTLKYRGKIVRKDFMQDDATHWANYEITKNIIIEE
jgi:atypical dual specificity phosphatase